MTLLLVIFGGGYSFLSLPKLEDPLITIREALVVVILLLGLRTGLIVGSFIPLVMLFGILAMRALGIDMEHMSLVTMIIVLFICLSVFACVTNKSATNSPNAAPAKTTKDMYHPPMSR